MIRLLIADDESETRLAIRETIPWEANGIQIAGEASDGREALGYAERGMADITLIDIRMPVMGGLETIAECRRRGFEMKFIVLSGYDDFAYARDSLNNGASAYLLKPSLPETILGTVLELRDRIENERRARDLYARLSEEFELGLPILKQRYLESIVAGRGTPEPYDESSLRFIRSEVGPGGITVAVVAIAEIATIRRESASETLEQMKYTVRKVAADFLAGRFRFELFDLDDETVIVLDTSGGEPEGLVFTELAMLRDEVSSSTGFTVTVGLGGRTASISEARASFRQAVAALSRRFFEGNGKSYSCEVTKSRAFDSPRYPRERESDVVESILANQDEGRTEAVAAFFVELSSSGAPPRRILEATVALLSTIHRLCVEREADLLEVFGREPGWLEELLGTETMEGLKKYASVIAERASRKIDENKASGAVDSALRFIEENYRGPIDLDETAAAAGVSASYFSVLFKRKTGVNFSEHLNKLRIRKACTLLENPNLKISTIASSVGYNDDKYFFSVFKKIMGVTPNQFREKMFRRRSFDPWS